MDKKKLPALAAGAALAALLGMNWALLGQVEDLAGEVEGLRSALGDLQRETTAALSRQEGALQRAVEEAGSLFSQTEAALSYEDGALVLEAAVVPKELRAGETAWLTLDTGERVPLTDDGSGWLRGRLTCSLREEVAPVVALTAQESTRQEALPALWTEEVLLLEGLTAWADETGGPQDLLTIQLSPGEGADLELEEVWVEVRSAVLDPEDPGSLAGRAQAVQGAEGAWTADLGAWLPEGEDYDWAFYLAAQAEGGLPLRSEGPAAEKSWEGDSGHGAAGSCLLLPAF